MKKRTQIEAELAQLALEIGGKSHSEAANAVLELYKNFALLAAEESIQNQLQSAQSTVEAQLRARIAELQGNIEVPAAPSAAPKEDAPVAGEGDNQLSLVDVAEEIEKEAAKASAEQPSEVEKIQEEQKVHAAEALEVEVPVKEEPQEQVPQEQAPEVAEPETKAPGAEEPVLKSREDRTVFQLDDAVAPQIEAPEPPAENIAEPVMMKSESVAEKAQSTEKKSLNDRLAGGALKFGLNDRIGFVKDLFDGSAEDFNRVVSQLNTLASLGEAQDFLATHIAPEYGWADNEETAERFMAAVEQRFG